MGGLEFTLVEIFIVATGPIDRLVEDLDVGQELLEAWVLRLCLRRSINGDTEFGQLLGQGNLIDLRQGHRLVGRRDWPDSRRDVIFRAVGQCGRGKKRKKQEGAHVGS